ncbi:MAG: uL15 family ribosomal protein [Thaumarchaeota archaeon]|nr:MAG: 50S ribosomal protein L15 [Nitrosopumilales archaeon]MCZ6582547.1 uL15 family ribosomal protein [Nitrososphaerota archaeon]GFN40326.1 MAG: 50S ribosomal protein L15 [Marine Group I thaumarchaeote]
MVTRLRKKRRLRGSRTHGWGQVGQHRASGHKGGLGKSGMLKHHFSGMLKTDPNHFGHDSTHPPHPTIIKKWISVRDLDDMFAKFGQQEDGKKIIDLKQLGYDKLLGGGEVKTGYTVKVSRFSASAQEKIKKAGGEVKLPNE